MSTTEVSWPVGRWNQSPPKGLDIDDEASCTICGTAIGAAMGMDPETGHDTAHWIITFATPSGDFVCEDCAVDVDDQLKGTSA